MVKTLKNLILCFIFILLFSCLGQASSLEPYVILQAEHGDIIGESLLIENDDYLSYVSVLNGVQQNDLLSMMLDIYHEDSYEFWVRVHVQVRLNSCLLNLISKYIKKI